MHKLYKMHQIFKIVNYNNSYLMKAIDATVQMLTREQTLRTRDVNKHREWGKANPLFIKKLSMTGSPIKI